MDTQTTPFRHVPPPGTGVARHSLASGFHPGQASLSLRLRVTGSRPCLSSPAWILGQWSTSQDHTTARTSRSSTLMSPSIGLEGHRDFILGTPGLTLVVVTSLPDDDLLGSLALDPRTPGSAPRPGTTVPRLVLVASLRPSRSP